MTRLGNIPSSDDVAEHVTQAQQNIQTGSNYTLVLSDAGKVIEMNNGSANTVTIPTNATVPFPIGTVVEVFQLGVGPTSIVGAGAVIVRLGGQLRTQYSTASLRKRAADTWVVSGDMA